MMMLIRRFGGTHLRRITKARQERIGRVLPSLQRGQEAMPSEPLLVRIKNA